MLKSKKIGVVGFPGLYGGAGVELDCQLTLWKEMGYEIHLIPTNNPQNEPLLPKTLYRATVHEARDYSKIKDMPVISFCNDMFLTDIKKIKKEARKTIFVNCMTWLFNDEKKAHTDGQIDLFLYQTNHTQKKVGPTLEKLNSKYNWKVFKSWFDDERFLFHKNRATDKFRFGRISREDGDKYSHDQLYIYNTMVAPVNKSGIILGFDNRSEKKIGTPPDWIRTYPGNGITQEEFYSHCQCIIQKADTYENWPRIGMEAMSSGSILIVDNRGGWTEMIKHGETGWLCNDQREFIYYSSRMAFEREEREKMSLRAKEYFTEVINNKEKSKEDWKEIFDG